MQYRLVGDSDLELPVITFGAWAIGGLFWGGSDEKDAVDAIKASIDHGANAIDTAPVYGGGLSESLVGKAIQGRRDDVLVLTKCGLRRDIQEGEYYFTIDAPDSSKVTVYRNTTAKSIIWECEQSLKRLGIDCIDLYQVHWPSTSAPMEETMTALNKLKEQGKIRQIGVSNFNADQLNEARRTAPVISNQIKYNLLERGIEKDPLPACRENNVGVICYSPMAMGLLTGKVTMDRQFPETDVRSSKPLFQAEARQKVLDACANVQPIAEAHQATIAQLAVAWVLAQPGISVSLVGARNPRQAIENAAGGDIQLTDDEVATLDQAFQGIEPAAP